MRIELQTPGETQPNAEGPSWQRVSRTRFKLAAVLVVIALGLIRSWVGRYSMNPDGINYLDLGDVFFGNRWAAAVNGYWSPLYAWLLGAVQFGLKPARWLEFPAAQLVNFFIYVAAFGAFEFFLRSMIGDQRQPAHEAASCPALGELSLRAISYTLFLWTSLELITIWDVSPDLFVAGVIYLIAGLLLRIRRDGSLRLYFILGAVLGLGYLTKAVMFPLGFAFMLIGLGWVQKARRILFLVTVTLTFLSVSAIWLVPLSRAKGRFDFGDSGRLNYAAYVSPQGKLLNWQGEPPGSGVPLHATRKIHDEPPVYEFAEPIAGTYPPAFDPSYWNEGRTITFDLRKQISIIAEHLLLYANLMLRGQAGLVAGVLTFLFVGGKATRTALLRMWPLFAMAACVFGLYALVHAEARFLGACITIFWMAILFAIRFSDGGPPRWAEVLTLAVAITILLSVADGTVRAIRARGPYSARDQIVIADDLSRMGLKSNDKVAVVGDGNWSYWARLGKFKIVSTVTSSDAPVFWGQGRAQKEQVYRAFASSGARAVISEPAAGAPSDDGWERIGGSSYFVRWLSR